MVPPSVIYGDCDKDAAEDEAPHESLAVPTRDDSPKSLRSRNGSARKNGTISDDCLPLVDRSHNNGNGYRRKESKGDESKRKQRIIGQEHLPPRLVLLANRIAVSSVFKFATQFARRNKIMTIFLGVFMYIGLRYNVKRHYIKYFGIHPIHGGSLGVKWDRHLTQRVIDSTAQRKSKELKELGVVLPKPHRTEPTELLQINTNAALREYLTRRELRARHLLQMEDVAEKYQRGCANLHENEPRSFFRLSGQSDDSWGIPKVLFLPDIHHWPSPRPGRPSGFSRVTFDESEMRHFIEDNYLPMLRTFDSLERLEDRVYLWSVCALYFYGGVFLSENAIESPQVVGDLIENSASSLFSGNDTECATPKGFAVFTKTKGLTAAKENEATVDMFMFAVTPRHPHLRCVINGLELAVKAVDASRILSSLFSDGSWESSNSFKVLHYGTNGPTWELLSSTCTYGHAHTLQCCHGMDFQPVPISPTEMEHKATTHLIDNGRLYVQLLEIDEPKKATEAESLVHVKVDVREKEGTEAPVKSKKLPFETIMKKKRIAPGWLCTRCLKTSLYGSLKSCAPVCNSGYENLMCYAPDDPERAEVIVEVTVNIPEEEHQRIPRIVHQTWFEELSPDRYPQLVRLQKSWINSGWDYRFYTDEQARDFIVRSFPSRFVDAFDALIPGAYKADLFRYLVLMKEGGVYADVDIMLDAPLDEFITPSLSFFVPRDVVGEYADESFCLWNGLIGSAPGHPFIVRAVERLVNLILERADLYDMERDVCRRVGRTMANWKIRAEPLLLASGPCALGVAVNDVLKRDSLSKFEIGWVPAFNTDYGRGNVKDHGDSLIMVGDKYDLGAFRISDPERSIMLASTDLPGVTKLARELSNPSRGDTRRREQRKAQLPHYSEAAKGEFVWGMHNVYHDDLVNNEIIKFDVFYN